MEGRRFHAWFKDKASRQAAVTWAAGQAIAYSSACMENRYFQSMEYKFGGCWDRKECVQLHRPKADQKYSHLIDREYLPWLKGVPGAVFRNGAVRHYRALNAFFNGVAKRPKPRRIGGPEKRLELTADLFTIEHEQKGRYRLIFGTPTKPAGIIGFKAHRSFKMPQTVFIKIHGTKVWVSFSTETDSEEDHYEEKREETIARLRMLSKQELSRKAKGVDRGVKRQIQVSDGRVYNTGVQEIRRRRRYERMRKGEQQKLSKCQKNSRGFRKHCDRVRKYAGYAGNVQKDFAHKASHALTADPETVMLVFEALRMKNLTKHPMAKQDEQTGEYLPNGASAKAGLNRSLLRSALGMVRQYTEYKARKHNILVVDVNPAYTSQTCHRCKAVDAKSRLSQAVFKCTHCGAPEINADLNASLVIRDRGIEMLLNGEIGTKTSKKLLRLGNKSRKTQPTRQSGTPCGDPSDHRTVGAGAALQATACRGTLLSDDERGNRKPLPNL